MIPKSKPNLILLAGPAGCGKTQHSIEAFQQEIGTRYAAGQVLERNGTEPVPAVPGTGIRDPLSDDLLLILPTAEHRTRTMDLILRRDLGGFFQRRITTFDRALREFLKLGGIEFATDVTRRIVLKEILMSNEFLYFKDAVAQPGFLDLLGKMIVELKEYLISPQEFKRRLSSLQERFPEFELKYADLEKIYEAYETE
ncbi:MAG: hypothetical protein HY588_03220, partial [Candidatus Omnitrophica bacterium]|nr:hypothetical protein [Candidatus Omnitrophota bacterium]